MSNVEVEVADVNIDVKHLTRVEGHGNIVVNMTEGKVEKVQWQVPEAPRFFEAMVRPSSAPSATCRIWARGWPS